jgi:nitrate/TMAO reductase-like tetraheme cytochrome c subunit
MRRDERPTSHRTRKRPAREGFQRRYRLVILGLFLAGVLAAVAVPVFAATEQPGFCTSCHEMKPFYSAFAAGPHKNVGCVECHVEPGIVARVGHKFVALKEVVSHFTRSPKFPGPRMDVPDSRCTTCHTKLAKTANGFDHASHTAALRCEKCHPAVGHQVTPAALAAEGVLRAGSPLSTSAASSDAVQLAALGTTAAATSVIDPDRTANHKQVGCMQCHDSITVCRDCHTAPHAERGECVTCHQADSNPKPFAFVHPDSTACETCHQPKHQDRGACTECHKPGTTWTFTHPAKSQRRDCQTCHPVPATNHANRKFCAGCHDPAVRFAQTAYDHQAPGRCAVCHTKPAGHSARACATCHKPGVDWTFVHPNLTSCLDCHPRPANHYGYTCSGCHKIGAAFKNATVNHSVVTGTCMSCHKPPASHRGRSPLCLTCHKLKGQSWKSTHPTSTACASCHQAPAVHFGSTCSSCHRPSVPFARATFNHPATANHSWRSFACKSCHPNGYASHSCTTCHGAGGGD